MADQLVDVRDGLDGLSDGVVDDPRLCHFDVLTPVMVWVETGTRPGRLVVGNATRTRPVYPYPTVARYDGTGSIHDAANFVPYRPHTAVHNDDNWVGQRLFSHGYQTTPHVVNGQLLL